MEASPLALVLFVGLLIAARAIFGEAAVDSGSVTLLFLLFVPAYLGASCWRDWRKLKRDQRDRASPTR